MTEQDKLKKLIKNEVFIAIQRAFPSCIDEECVKPGIADKHEAATEATDSILFLIDGQRCVWEHDSEGDWRTGCKAWYAYDYSTEDSFCPSCGKRIEVKDAITK
jgi:hypothetical protein